jgi:tRNA(Arg) A34 adenosine deaminase TadA
VTLSKAGGYGRYLTDFVLYSTHEPCAMCAGACVWSRIGAVVFGVSQEDIAAYGRKRGTDDYKWRACLISCRYVLKKGNHRSRHRRFSPPRMPKTLQLQGYIVARYLSATLSAHLSGDPTYRARPLPHNVE